MAPGRLIQELPEGKACKMNIQRKTINAVHANDEQRQLVSEELPICMGWRSLGTQLSSHEAEAI